MRGPQVAVAMLLGGVLVGCGSTVAATEVMVIVDAEPGVQAQTQKLHVVASGGVDNAAERGAFDRTFSLSAGDLEWPVQTALVPMKGDASRVYEFVASALDTDGNTVAQVRAVSGYVPHQRLALRLLLEDSCISKTCGGGLSCKAGACTSAKVDPGKLLPLSEASLHTVAADGGQSMDSGPRLTRRDGGTDAGAHNGGGSPEAGGAGVGGMGGGAGGSGSAAGAGAAGAGGGRDGGSPDASVAADSGPGPRFVDNGDGTISDTTTGLEWQQINSKNEAGQTATAGYCSSLSLNGSGWRLPTLSELTAITDTSRNPALDPAIFPLTGPFPNSCSGMTGANGIANCVFWTSSACALSSSPGFWTVDMNLKASALVQTCSDIGGGPTGGHLHRCVR